MSLTLVSIPIGDYGDITLRAIETLKTCDALICEEIKPAQILFKRSGLEFPKKYFLLNEHSKKEELPELVGWCREENVALISDAGTPGFYDPGAELVEACMREKVDVHINPGVTSLGALLSVTGEKIGEFLFIGFLPAEKEQRQRKLNTLKTLKTPFVIMDTPYRLQATVREVATLLPEAVGVMGCDLTGDKHQVKKESLKHLASQDWPKAPFILMVFP